MEWKVKNSNVFLPTCCDLIYVYLFLVWKYGYSLMPQFPANENYAYVMFVLLWCHLMSIMWLGGLKLGFIIYINFGYTISLFTLLSWLFYLGGGHVSAVVEESHVKVAQCPQIIYSSQTHLITSQYDDKKKFLFGALPPPTNLYTKILWMSYVLDTRYKCGGDVSVWKWREGILFPPRVCIQTDKQQVS